MLTFSKIKFSLLALGVGLGMSFTSTNVYADCTLTQYKTFSALDENGDGVLTGIEGEDAIRKAKLVITGKPNHLSGWLGRYDVNSDGRVRGSDTAAMVAMLGAIANYPEYLDGGCEMSHLRAYSYMDLSKSGRRLGHASLEIVATQIQAARVAFEQEQQQGDRFFVFVFSPLFQARIAPLFVRRRGDGSDDPFFFHPRHLYEMFSVFQEVFRRVPR